MKVAITGQSGLVGQHLTRVLQQRGDEVVPIVRGGGTPGAITWDPTGQLDPGALAGIDAVVHLAGEPIGSGRWSAAKKDRIRRSRVEGTRTVAEAMAKAQDGPQVLVSASAVGWYGDRGDEVLTETSSPGDDFLAHVCQDWEAACDPARNAGVRVANLRFGIVLSPDGGALGKVLPLFRMGVGGPLASGRQWWSWVSIDDVSGAIAHALRTDGVDGAVNVTAPHPVRNREWSKVLGTVLGRPAVLPAPAPALKLVFGEMADAMLFASQRALPNRLADSGYSFRHAELEGAFRELLRR